MSRKRNERSLVAYTAVAGAAITPNQALVAGTAEDLVVPATGGAGEKFMGFSTMKAAVGQSVGRNTVGEASPLAVGALQYGDRVKLAAGGKVTKAVDADLAAGLDIGLASSSAVDGEPVTVEMN